MTVLIGSWEFEGPFTQPKEFLHQPGIYAILSCSEEEYELLEIDETESVRATLERHERFPIGQPASASNVAAAVYYCADLTSSLREGLIEEVLKEFNAEVAC
jgi:hypothetical protein